MKISEAESGPPTQDLNWSMKYWEDRNCHPLIYVGDFPYKALKTTSHNREVADVRHEADRMFTSMGRTATRTGGWLDMENTSDTDWSIIHGMLQEHGNSAMHEGIWT